MKNLLKKQFGIPLIVGVGILMGLLASLSASAQAPGPAAPTSPVVIYDDLMVYGNGTPEEPGNTFIRGDVYAQGNINSPQSLNVGTTTATHQLSGDLTVTGDLNSTRDVNIAGGLNLGTSALPANLILNGGFVWDGTPITPGGGGGGGGGGAASTFGVVRGEQSAQIDDTNEDKWQRSRAQCQNAGDTMIFCGPDFSFERPIDSNFEWMQNIEVSNDQATCLVAARSGRSFDRSEAFTVRAYAVCSS